MVDQSMMGETIDREANNETAMKGEVGEAEFEVYMPRQQVSALLRLERPMMYVCSGEPIKFKIKAVIPPTQVPEKHTLEPVNIEKPISALVC
jgi:hypothetical protein